MKVSNPFKEIIKAHLDKRASEDELFEITYQKENKNLEECCNYLMQCAKKGGCGGYSDDEVFGWAIHYYDEDDIKDIKAIAGKVIVNHSVELTEQDKAEAKKKAIENFILESKEEAKKEFAEKIELTEDDIEEAKKIAINKVVDSEREKMIKKATKKKVDLNTEGVIDLFSM